MADPASALGRGLATRLLGDESWARERLAAHAGRTFTLASGPVSVAFAIGADGTLEDAHSRPATPDAEFHLSPFDVPALLAEPARWDGLVTAKGDPALAATLRDLAQTLPWFVERAFAKAFGPVVGQRLADAGRSILSLPGYVGEHLADNVVSYARDEAGLLARGEEARAFAAQNADLAQRVDALAQRIADLERK
jgi:ubiquinone biosynthesis protein UbiJ